MKTKIVISAVNLVEGGPLTILRSCLKALNDYSAYNDVEVLALVHKKELCSFSNITYIEVPWAKNNWIYRIFFEFFYLKKIKTKNILVTVGIVILLAVIVCVHSRISPLM